MPDTLLGNAADPAASTTTTDNGGATGNGAAGDHWLVSKFGIPADAVDEKARGFKDPAALYDSWKNGQKLISSKGYARPADDADAATWDRFYGSVGRPAAPTEYEWQAPEGVQIADDRLAEVRGELHKAGLDKRQYKAVLDLYAKESQAQAQAQSRKDEQLKTESTAKLKAEFGSKDYESRIQRATATAQQLGILDAVNESGLGLRAEVILALDRIASKIGEDSAVRGQSSGNLDAEIDGLNARILKMSSSDPGLPALERQRSELFARRGGKK